MTDPAALLVSNVSATLRFASQPVLLAATSAESSYATTPRTEACCNTAQQAMSTILG